MKKITKTLFFIALFSMFTLSSQTEAERKRITSTYDLSEINKAKEYIYTENLKRLARITNYLESLSPIELANEEIEKLRDVTLEGKPLYYVSHNFNSARTIRADRLYSGGSLGLDLTGENMIAGLWEAENGYPLTSHVDLAGKITFIDGVSSSNFHGTHVAGTIISSGESSFANTGRGIAYNATLRAANSSNDYGEMTTEAANGLLLSNHSYGFRATSLDISDFGKYNLANSYQVDLIINSNPYYLPVFSAGNDRNNNPAANPSKGGFDLLSANSVSKNGITSAAVEQVSNYNGPGDVVMSSFSNYGPTDDGRIKPDISSQGVSVLSTSNTSNTAYSNSNGTSMSAPAITGLLLLLQEHYNNLNSNFMLSATARGLLLHTADEAGLINGPDYSFGWGLANGEAAANAISQNSMSSVIDENTLLDTAEETFNIRATGGEPLEVSICWNDPVPDFTFFTFAYGTAVDDRSPVIVNDLDLKLSYQGTDYFPWKLDPINPSAPATRTTTNDVDNFEKVEIDSPTTNGIYTVTIDHKQNLQGLAQDYSLIVTGGVLMSLSTNDLTDLDKQVRIYPNPTTDKIYFANSSNFNLVDYKIYDSLGRLAIQGEFKDLINANFINVSQLKKGIYYMHIKSDIGSITKKIIKSF